MKNNPHIVTGITGSHCLVVFQDKAAKVPKFRAGKGLKDALN